MIPGTGSSWQFITDLGDSALTVPLAVLVAVFQVALQQYRLARSWSLAVCASGILITVLKIAFGACGSRAGMLGMISPSGHVAVSTTVYLGSALWLGSVPASRWRLAVFSAASALLVVAIAVSRVVLQRHVWPEVVTGFGVGLLAAVWYWSALRSDPPTTVPLRWFVVPALLLVGLLHGTRWVLEPAIQHLAAVLKVGWCS